MPRTKSNVDADARAGKTPADWRQLGAPSAATRKPCARSDLRDSRIFGLVRNVPRGLPITLEMIRMPETHFEELMRYVRFGDEDTRRLRAFHAVASPHFERI